MDKARFRLMAGLAGVTLAMFAATGYGQNTNTPTAGGSASTPADQSAQTGTSGSASTQAPTDAGTTIGTTSRTTTTDVTTTTPSTTFWLSPWGIAAIAVVAILLLWAIFGRRGSTVVRDSYTSSSTRNVGTVNDRIVSPRAASGTETTTTRTTDTDTRL